MIESKPRDMNKTVRFKNVTILRIVSLGSAVAVLLFVSIFLHFSNASVTSSSQSNEPSDITSTGDIASSELSGLENPVAKGYAESSFPGNNTIRGAVLSGNSLVYKIDKPAREREPIILTLFASDPDGDELFYSVSNMPDGASFNPGNLTFNWTPRYNQAGTHIIRFEVSDGLVSDFEDVTIDVIQYGENWDVNVDGSTNILDIVLVGQHWNETGLTAWVKEDTNEDGTVNVLDMIVIGQHWTG